MLLAIHLFLKEKEFADQSSYMEHEITSTIVATAIEFILWFV